MCQIYTFEVVIHATTTTVGYFKGQLIPAQQPKLFSGGIMRSYQIDGMEWIKVGLYVVAVFMQS